MKDVSRRIRIAVERDDFRNFWVDGLQLIVAGLEFAEEETEVAMFSGAEMSCRSTSVLKK